MNAATPPKAVKTLLVLVALTAGLSLLYGIQYYLGGPLRLSVVSELHDLVLNPNGSLAAAGAEDGTVRLWDVPRSKAAREQGDDWPTRELPGHRDAVVSVAFDPTGATLFSASRDGTIRLWDVADGQVEIETVLNVPGGKGLSDMSLSADGGTLACIETDGLIHVWDVAAGQVTDGAHPIQSIGPSEDAGRTVALSPDGSLVAAGDGENIQIWDARTGEPVQRLEGYWEDEITQKDWLGHEKELCQEFLRFKFCQANKVTTLSFSPDGTILASGSADKLVVFWDTETGEVKGIGRGHHFAAITKVVFNQQGNAVLSASQDRRAKSWQAPGGRVTGTFKWHLSAVKGVAFGPDPDSVLTAGDDGTLRLWDVVNENELHVEWTAEGFQPVWGKLFRLWLPVSGLLGLVCVWGLWKARGWGHLLALALYVVGPVVVLGLPLLEVSPLPPRRVTADILMLVGSLACFVVVLVKLFRNEGPLRGIAGLLVPLYTFIWGWVKAIDLRIERTMAIWSILLGPLVVLGLPLLRVSPFYPLSVAVGILMILASSACFVLVLVKLLPRQRVLRWIAGLLVPYCLVLLLIRFLPNEGALRWIGGLFLPLYTLVLGWVKATDLQIERITLGWLSLAISMIAIVLLVPGDYPHDFLSTSADGYTLGVRLQISWPLIALGLWYGVLVAVLMREPVAVFYEAPRGAALAEQLMATLRTRQVRIGLFIGTVWVVLLVILYSVLRRFNLDTSFMGHFLSFIMEGAEKTAVISLVSISLAVVLALLGALGRLSNNPVANGVSGFYISLIRGTPLLVQIYIWYLGLPRLGIILRADHAGILALGVNYGAYMTEIFRAGIQAIGIGQHEAAQALGMSRTQTLRRIVLPQAFRIVIPPIGNEFIAMMKDSSLVSIMGVMELTFRAEKMGRRYFRGMETFIIAAGFYWVLTVIFQFLQGNLESYMARGERR